MEDIGGFYRNLTGLAIALGVEMTEAKLAIYERALSRFPDEQVTRAIDAAIVTLRFFPKPVELIELIDGKKEDQSTLAWDALYGAIKSVGAYQSVIFGDGRISKAVQLMGGWEAVCGTNVDGEGLKWLRIEFEKIYRTLPAGCPQELLPGIGERNAVSGGWSDRVKAPAMIGCGNASSRTISLPETRKKKGFDPATEDQKAELGKFIGNIGAVKKAQDLDHDTDNA